MPNPPSAPIPRHYGLDWLRIGAFALLILFHIGLYFAPGHWIVKTPQPAAWVAWPLAAIVPWRLSVLFAVSGYATAAMIQRSAGLGAFLAERSRRLLIPLAFGMLVVVPPQEWVRIEVGGGNPSFGSFLGHDAFSFARHAGAFMPGWEHLWFLLYLLGYTGVLCAALALLPRWRVPARRALAWLATGSRLVWLPPLPMVAGMVLSIRLPVPALAESIDYLPAFLFGFAFAHCPGLRAAVRRNLPLALTLSLAALGGLWATMALAGPGMERPEKLIALVAGGLMSWTMILVAFDLAGRFLDRDHAWRAPLAAAVFPAYIVHQTVIVVVGWQLRVAGIAGWAAFAIQLGAVLAACCAAWLAARHVPLLGTLLGMPRKAQKERPARLAPA